MKADLELTLCPGEDRISLVRRFVEQYYERVLDDLDAVARIAMAVHELLENAAKYSSNGVAHMRIAVEPAPTAARVRLELRNRGTDQSISALKQAFDEMSQFDDPFVWYQAAMRKSAKRKEGSGLGLARIAAEGEMKLSLALQGDEACVSAEMEVAKRGTA